MNCSVPEMLAQAATHVDTGEFAQAEAVCRRVLALEPQNPHVLHVQGVAARKQRQHTEAAALFRRSLEIAPRNFAVEFELGVVLIEQKQWSEALVHFRRALELNPDYQPACVNIATLLERLDRIEEALPWADRAVQMSPDCATAHFNLANMQQAAGRVREAIDLFDETLRLKPDHDNARWNGSLSRLLIGDFAGAWPMYEARMATGTVVIDDYPQPRWQGEPLEGKTILIHAEQGIGDEVLFASCLPDLIAKGGRVVVVCDPRLQQLFARSFPKVHVHGIARRKDRAPAAVPERIDYQLPAGNLPGFFRRSREAFPRRWRFLHAAPIERETWRSRIDELGPGLKVGISWRAGGQPLEHRKRTTTLAQWLPILEQRGVRFINLQYGDASDELSAARRELGVTIHEFAEGDPLRDLDAFAARLSALDLVISVGNATVHLAGALGVPAWSLLPRVPAWPWMSEGEQSLWYPSVRLFRQPERGQWPPVFQAVAAALASRTGRAAPSSRHALNAAAAQPTDMQATHPRQPSVDTSLLAQSHSEVTRPMLTLSDVTDTFQAAVDAYQRQEHTRADAICQQILAHAPRDAKALHLRGLIARATGRLELAICSLSLASEVYSGNLETHLHLADAFVEVGRLEDAVASYRRAIDLDPNQVRPHNALAATQMMLHRWTEAEQILRKAIELKPDYVAAISNLGRCLQMQGRLEEAAEQLRRAVSFDAQCAQAVANLHAVESELAGREKHTPSAGAQENCQIETRTPTDGGAVAGGTSSEQIQALVSQAASFYNQGRMEEAVALAERLLVMDVHNVTALRILGVAARTGGDGKRALELIEQALQHKPHDYALHFERGVALAGLHRSREALAAFLRTRELRPTFHPAYVNISAIYEEQERYEEAIEWTRKALELKPDCSLSYYNLANALRESGQIEAAVEAYQRSQELNPAYLKTDWNLAISYLLIGDYKHGWPRFERRIDLGEVEVDDYAQPRWDGTSLAGKTILIHAEQGIGDEVLFASCFDDVIAQARHCVIVCEPRLEALFRRSFPRATVYGYQRTLNRAGMKLTEAIDVQIPAGSLPLYLRNSRADFPTCNSLLQVDASLLAFWQERMAALGPGLKIGISWRAGGKPQERRKRMIPLELWRSTLTTPGVHFINLQYSDSSEEVAQIGRELGIRIHDWEEGDPLVDMDSFAAKVKALDLVISVGNATVHIAGSVGTEAWALLPMVPSWRWMVRGEQSPWYPSVTLVRQPKRGDWASVMDETARRLRSRVGAPTDIIPCQPVVPPGSLLDDEHWYQATEVNAEVMVGSVATSLSEGARLLSIGDLAAAEKHYREVLQIAPRHFQALHGLGVVARLSGRTDLAIRSFQRSLAMVEGIAVHHSNYAAALGDAGRWEEARLAYTRALELDPGFSKARIDLGHVLQRLGQHQQALAEFSRAALAGEKSVELLVSHGISLARLYQIDEAMDCFERALRLDPAHLPALTALADVYLEDQQYEDAERCLRRAIAIRGDVAVWHSLLGQVLRHQGELAAAVEAVETAVALAPTEVAILSQLGALYREAGDPERAAETFTRALELAPEDVALLNAAGLALADCGQPAAAIARYDQALQIQPYTATTHVHRAFALLMQGNLAEGWREYAWRTQLANAPRTPSLQIPAWSGEPLAGKSILVYGEQSAGDELLFAACYGELLATAGQVAVLCQPRLELLFRRSFPQATILSVPRGQEATVSIPADLHLDYQVAAGNLPAYWRRTRQQFNGAGYLQAAPQKIAHWRERYATLGPGLKVGIAWRSPDSAYESHRNADALESWLPLLRTPGVQFVSLQAGEVRAELQQFAQAHGIVVHHWNDADNTADLDGLAARMLALDLVISTSGTPAHLAGSLGAACWCLLPNAGDWHWLSADGESDEEFSLWHRSVRLFRLYRSDKPENLLNRAAAELLNRARVPVEEPKRAVIAPPHGIVLGGGPLRFGGIADSTPNTC